MECKYILQKLGVKITTRINRNIVECKLNIEEELETVKGELIETLWNVNDLLPDKVRAILGN